MKNLNYFTKWLRDSQEYLYQIFGLWKYVFKEFGEKTT